MTRMVPVLVVIALTSSVVRAQEACPCCVGSCDEPVPDPAAVAEVAELRGVFAGSLALASLAYLFSTAYAQSQPHSHFAVDSVPVFGAIAAAARSDGGDQVPVLLFAAGVQVIGTLWAIAAGTDLAQATESLRLSVQASRQGGGVSFSWPLP